jgi:hypothetical protein
MPPSSSLRAGLDPIEHEQFMRKAEYRAVLVLLAIVIGQPDHAPTICRAIATSPATALNDAFPIDLRDDRSELTAMVERMCSIASQLGASELATYQRWLPRVAQFSFRTQDLLTDARPVVTADRRGTESAPVPS